MEDCWWFLRGHSSPRFMIKTCCWIHKTKTWDLGPIYSQSLWHAIIYFTTRVHLRHSQKWFALFMVCYLPPFCFLKFSAFSHCVKLNDTLCSSLYQSKNEKYNYRLLNPQNWIALKWGFLFTMLCLAGKIRISHITYSVLCLWGVTKWV